MRAPVSDFLHELADATDEEISAMREAALKVGSAEPKNQQLMSAFIMIIDIAHALQSNTLSDVIQRKH